MSVEVEVEMVNDREPERSQWYWSWGTTRKEVENTNIATRLRILQRT